MMGTRHLLTDKQIEAAKPAPAGRRYILWDALVPSLGLRVTEHRHKSFVVQRRVNGRMVKLTLGEYPALPLIKAREKAREALEEMSAGRNPLQTQAQRVTASGLRRDSFEGAVETYIKRDVEKNRRPRTQHEIIRPLRTLLVPKWGSLPLDDIGPKQIIAVLDELVDDGKPVAANRTYSVVRRFFRWCVERHLVAVNPAAAVRKPTKEESRSRVLGDDELWEVWTACERLGWPFGPFVQSLILTGQRRNELAGMDWAEIDLDARQWTIPLARTKNAKEHIVPLSATMVAVLNAAPCFEPNDKSDRRPVFTTTATSGVSGFSRAKNRLDGFVLARRRKEAEARGREPDKAKSLPAWTLHDLRRSCATGMGRIGIQPHIIEAVLNHSSGFRNGIAGVYQRHPYLEERRHALEAWAKHLAMLATPGEPPGNIVSFRRNNR